MYMEKSYLAPLGIFYKNYRSLSIVYFVSMIIIVLEFQKGSIYLNKSYHL